MYSKDVDIVLFTDDAYYLFMGGALMGNGPFIPNFFYTKREMDKLLPMAYKSNPFAVSGLKTIELLIQDINNVTEIEIEKCKSQLKKKKEQGINVHLIGKREPYVKEINMVNHFTQMMIDMIINCDNCFRHIRTVNLAHCGADEIENIKKIRELRNKVRHLFQRTVTFGKRIKPGITVQDVLEKSERSKRMIDLFGIPHEKVLSGNISYKSHNIGILAYD